MPRQDLEPQGCRNPEAGSKVRVRRLRAKSPSPSSSSGQLRSGDITPIQTRTLRPNTDVISRLSQLPPASIFLDSPEPADKKVTSARKWTLRPPEPEPNDEPESRRDVTRPRGPESTRALQDLKQPRLPKPKETPLATKVQLPSIFDPFWSDDSCDDENSPVLTFEPAPPPTRSPTKPKPKRAAKSGGAAETPVPPTPSSRRVRQDFELTKHKLAEDFLKELDDTITEGKLGVLAASTGGIKINWTNKLKTTAGRANWKRETTRTGAAADGAIGGAAAPQHRHHASIDLAEKVISCEDRLLNVIAHEFCHLANFMVSGVTGNPHGKEFKAWAAKCSRAFGHRGIEVTTKHTYEIDFKYVWECTGCAVQFKRHSKSISPERHRCRTCKGTLRQIKPVPRSQEGGKISKYQLFVKEQMQLVKKEYPASPQKDIMRIIAERWRLQSSETGRVETSSPGEEVDEITAKIQGLEV